MTYFDLGSAMKNKLVGWVDSDFGSDVDSRKSMTGFLMSLNGGPISWKSSRQGGVTLSSSEVEFVVQIVDCCVSNLHIVFGRWIFDD